MNKNNNNNGDFNRGNESLPLRTQFLIFTLFGDYMVYRDGKIWTGDLLYLMGLLGISERAVRSTLSRMAQKGWVKSQKHGRRSRYSLTSEGSALLDAGHRRIFEPIFTNWNRQWHMVVYSLPEKKRPKRHALRTQLLWLGYGSLAPGTWISPHDRSAELQKFLIDIKAKPHVDLFIGTYLGPAASQDLVKRCWDLSGLEAQYQEFIDHYQPAYLECLEKQSKGQSLSPEECFLRRFWLMHEFQSFPLKDPNLPKSLLPEGWPGITARTLFDTYRELLGTSANQFIDEIVHSDTA